MRSFAHPILRLPPEFGGKTSYHFVHEGPEAKSFMFCFVFYSPRPHLPPLTLQPPHTLLPPLETNQNTVRSTAKTIFQIMPLISVIKVSLIATILLFYYLTPHIKTDRYLMKQVIMKSRVPFRLRDGCDNGPETTARDKERLETGF